MRTLHKRSLMPAAIGATAIAWIACVLSGRLVAHRGDRSDSGDYMRTLHKRSLMPAATGTTAIAWIALVLSGRLVAHRGDRIDSGDYMRTSLYFRHEADFEE